MMSCKTNLRNFPDQQTEQRENNDCKTLRKDVSRDGELESKLANFLEISLSLKHSLASFKISDSNYNSMPWDRSAGFSRI